MDSLSDYAEQAYKDDVKLGVKNPGMRCVQSSPAEESLKAKIVSILESIKVTVGYREDGYGAPEGGWPTPVMEKMRDVVGL